MENNEAHNEVRNSDLYKIEQVTSSDDKIIKEIIHLEEVCFPKSWGYEDAEDYYKDRVSDPANISIFLKSAQDTVGYSLGIPYSTAFNDLRDDDPEMPNVKDGSEKFYIETIQISPKFQGMGGGRILLEKICKLSAEKNYTAMAIHARISNGLSEKIKKIFENNVYLVRQIPSWKHGGGEPYEYLEWNIK